MATILGAGLPPAAAWCPNPVVTSCSPSSSISREVAKLDEPGGEMLVRITSVLAGVGGGLTLAELRARVPEPAGALRRAIAAGLRVRQLRRLGAHHGLRYVLNAQ
jgi:hypothetical protein